MYMSSERIDIHGYEQALEVGLARLDEDPLGLGVRNIQLIREFCRDCSMGKTVMRRAKKRISAGRVFKYLHALRQIAFWLGTDFDKVSPKEMEGLVSKIDNNQLTFRGYPPRSAMRSSHGRETEGAFVVEGAVAFSGGGA